MVGFGVLVGRGVDVGGRGVKVRKLVGGRVCVYRGVLVGVRVVTRVGVRVAIRVGVRVAIRVGVLDAVRACAVRAWAGRVAVPSRVRVGTGVKVLLGVNVGVAETRGVSVGVEEAVRVGIVWVGNGPSSDCAVPAKAVLMALRSDPEPLLRPNTRELLKVIPRATMMNPTNNPACRRGFT